jgi:hypothetical protein
MATDQPTGPQPNDQELAKKLTELLTAAKSAGSMSWVLGVVSFVIGIALAGVVAFFLYLNRKTADQFATLSGNIEESTKKFQSSEAEIFALTRKLRSSDVDIVKLGATLRELERKSETVLAAEVEKLRRELTTVSRELRLTQTRSEQEKKRMNELAGRLSRIETEFGFGEDSLTGLWTVKNNVPLKGGQRAGLALILQLRNSLLIFNGAEGDWHPATRSGDQIKATGNYSNPAYAETGTLTQVGRMQTITFRRLGIILRRTKTQD